MANNKKDNKPAIRFNVLKKLAASIQNNTDDLYKTTYFSSPENKQQLLDLKSDIDNSIKDIISTTKDNSGEPNISKLYERMFLNKQNNSEINAEFEKIFGDNEFINNLSSSYLDNMWITAADREIDDILRYMPKLNEAVQTLRDNVLSADSFTKDFLSLKNDMQDVSADSDKFASNIETMKKNYKLLELVNDSYDDISKYGEDFIYCVPYEKAIQRLMDRKQSSSIIHVKSNFKENTIIMESAVGDNTKIDSSRFNLDKYSNSDFDFNVEIKSGIIESVVISEKEARDKVESVREQSLYEQFLNEASIITGEISNVPITRTTTNYEIDGSKLPTHHNFDKTLHDDLELPEYADTTADGLVQKQKQKNGRIKHMNGCIVKRLRRDRVTPILIEDVCLGYYYFEFDENAEFIEDRQPTMGMVNTITGLRSNGKSEAFDAAQRREEMLRYLSSELADRITSDFVNANQDLRKEIYYILKYNDDYSSNISKNNIRVTYIPPEDIHHLYFKLDNKTNRGISDLKLALIPAKLWVAIYITNCLAIMTRGNDKRVYYVKQSVETNISKTLLKTINEIKKSNFGIRQIENINNVLNITGRFNDYIIPRGADGQSPIEFEVMPGQQIEIKTDLLNLLEESAINSTNVPLELIQMRQSPEYATQLTMTSTKFLRFAYSRQSRVQEIYGPLFTKIYNIEYSNNDVITVKLPPPLFINMTNTNQLIMNTTEFCNSLVEIFMGDEKDDILKAKFAKKLKIHYLGSYLDINDIIDIYNESKQEATMDDITKGSDEDGVGY